VQAFFDTLSQDCFVFVNYTHHLHGTRHNTGSGSFQIQGGRRRKKVILWKPETLTRIPNRCIQNLQVSLICETRIEWDDILNQRITLELDGQGQIPEHRNTFKNISKEDDTLEDFELKTIDPSFDSSIALDPVEMRPTGTGSLSNLTATGTASLSGTPMLDVIEEITGDAIIVGTWEGLGAGAFEGDVILTGGMEGTATGLIRHTGEFGMEEAEEASITLPDFQAEQIKGKQNFPD
jgi:hypothetical protein